MNAAWSATATENATKKTLREIDPDAYYQAAFGWIMVGVFLVSLIAWLSK